jgi:hypothetical protein
MVLLSLPPRFWISLPGEIHNLMMACPFPSFVTIAPGLSSDATAESNYRYSTP